MVNDRLGIPLFLIFSFSESRQEAPVTNYTAPKFHYLAGAPNHDARSEPSVSDAAAGLTPGAGLVVVLLLSLGLWAVKWLGLSFLAAAWFG